MAQCEVKERVNTFSSIYVEKPFSSCKTERHCQGPCYHANVRPLGDLLAPVFVNIDSYCQENGLAPTTYNCKIICGFRAESGALSAICEVSWTRLRPLSRQNQSLDGADQVKPMDQEMGLL